MKPLWASWPSFQQQVRETKRLLLVLDYDGTLTPIRDHPAKAHLPSRTKWLIERLARQPRVRVALISGRSLRDLKQVVGVSGALYAGNHGLELRGRGVSFAHPEARRFRPVLRRLAQRLRGALRHVPGAWVEWKGLTLSLHYRQVNPADRQRFDRLTRELLAPLHARRAICVTRGKCVVEVRPPVQWDKGQAVSWILRQCRRPAPRVIYLGDDRTDEDAFRVVNRLGGMSVFVGPPGHSTAARWRVANPRAVATVLRRILELYG